MGRFGCSKAAVSNYGCNKEMQSAIMTMFKFICFYNYVGLIQSGLSDFSKEKETVLLFHRRLSPVPSSSLYLLLPLLLSPQIQIHHDIS